MRILLINPPMMTSMPPLVMPFGIAYIADALERNGHEVELLDIDSHRLSRESVLRRIETSVCDIIGIGGLATIYPYLDWLVPEIRRMKSGKKIILGGAIASSLREKCFERFGIDYEVIGEGEVTIVELLRAIEKGGDPGLVKGIGFRKDSGIIFTENRPLMASLDDVPMIDDAMFPVDELLKNSEGALQIHAQRGCPSSCTFCFNCFRVVSNKIRYRPVKNILDEIEGLKGKYGKKIKLFALSGECLTMNKGWIIDFCKQILDRGLKIDYRVTSRVDTIDEERLEWLRRSGCKRMSFGLETGSDKIIKIIRKGVSVEQGKKAIAMAKKYIPVIEASIMLGYLGEDRLTLQDTIRFCKELGVKPLIFHALPFPGTELYKMAVAKGCIKDEEAFMMKLDRASISNRSVNLTEMPDDVAAREVEAAKDEIERYYFYKNFGIKAIGSMFSDAYSSVKRNGVGATAVKIARTLKKYAKV